MAVEDDQDSVICGGDALSAGMRGCAVPGPLGGCLPGIDLSRHQINLTTALRITLAGARLIGSRLNTTLSLFEALQEWDTSG